LSIADAFTNYVTFVPLPNKEAAAVADAVYKKLICVHGAPARWVSLSLSPRRQRAPGAPSVPLVTLLQCID
jgi:hypothetical protein